MFHFILIRLSILHNCNQVSLFSQYSDHLYNYMISILSICFQYTCFHIVGLFDYMFIVIISVALYQRKLWRTVWRFLKKLKIELPCGLAIPLLGIYMEETKIERDTCTPMFIATMFIIARTWKQPDVHRSMDKKAVVHIHNGVLLSH